MPYSDELADRLRTAASGAGRIEERKMFGSLCFMVNGKLWACAQSEGILWRVGTAHHEAAVQRSGASPMRMRDRLMKGYVRVEESALRASEEFNYWVQLSLQTNSELTG